VKKIEGSFVEHPRLQQLHLSINNLFKMTAQVPNPLELTESLKRPLNGEQLEEAHPPQPILPEDSAITKAEKVERNGANGDLGKSSSLEPPAAKRQKIGQPAEQVPQDSEQGDPKPVVDARDKVKGIALVKPE